MPSGAVSQEHRRPKGGVALTKEPPLNPEHCLVEREGHVLVVTLNRPEAKNALSGGMFAELWTEGKTVFAQTKNESDAAVLSNGVFELA